MLNPSYSSVYGLAPPRPFIDYIAQSNHVLTMYAYVSMVCGVVENRMYKISFYVCAGLQQLSDCKYITFVQHKI